MKKSELQLLKPFYNQNRHLSIVYNITDTKYHILNYNGSFYSLTKDNSEVDYLESEITIEQFFDGFPVNKLHFDTKVVYNAVRDKYFMDNFARGPQQEDNRVLLLLI